MRFRGIGFRGCKGFRGFRVEGFRALGLGLGVGFQGSERLERVQRFSGLGLGVISRVS